jgi:hypothetical protein
MAGGGPTEIPSFALFGAGPTGQGTPLTSGFDLYSVVPEPSICALLTFAFAAFFLVRCRKC